MVQVFLCKKMAGTTVLHAGSFRLDIHNQEFVRLLAASGWHQARATRELGLTSGTVSRYVAGKAKPSLPVLRLFAERISEPLILPGESGKPSEWREGGPKFLETWEARIIASLRRLERPARERVIDAIDDIIDAVSKPVRYTKPPKKEPEVQAPQPHALPHPEDEESVISALEEIIQAGREEDEARAAATQARRSTDEKQPLHERDPAHSTPRRSVPGHRPSKSGGG